MTGGATELRLPSGTVLAVETSAPADAALGPASIGDGPGATIDLARDVLPGLSELAEQVVGALEAAAPSTVGIEIGVKLGGKTGFILAEGTAEASLKLTLTWNRS